MAVQRYLKIALAIAVALTCFHPRTSEAITCYGCADQDADNTCTPDGFAEASQVKGDDGTTADDACTKCYFAEQADGKFVRGCVKGLSETAEDVTAVNALAADPVCHAAVADPENVVEKLTLKTICICDTADCNNAEFTAQSNAAADGGDGATDGADGGGDGAATSDGADGTDGATADGDGDDTADTADTTTTTTEEPEDSGASSIAASVTLTAASFVGAIVYAR